MAADVQVTELTDPGCSWAWGSEPKLRLLRHRYRDRLVWRRVMGGMFADLARHNPSFDAEALAPDFARYWQAVADRTGMPWPAKLRWVYRSTEPACLAVKAAERQGPQAADEALRRLREATFVFGEPPDTRPRIAAGLRGARHVDVDRLLDDLESAAVAEAFAADWEETRQPNEHVRRLDPDEDGSGAAKQDGDRWRYAFPTLIIRGPEGEQTVPGWADYGEYVNALHAVAPGVADTPPGRPPSPEDALAEAGSMAERELAVLCGGAAPPPAAVPYDYGAGTFWLDPVVAAGRGQG
jgi:protein-disulfide isomerase-like protein with CxxC motif